MTPRHLADLLEQAIEQKAKVRQDFVAHLDFDDHWTTTLRYPDFGDLVQIKGGPRRRGYKTGIKPFRIWRHPLLPEREFDTVRQLAAALRELPQ